MSGLISVLPSQGGNMKISFLNLYHGFTQHDWVAPDCRRGIVCHYGICSLGHCGPGVDELHPIFGMDSHLTVSSLQHFRKTLSDSVFFFFFLANAHYELGTG